jgi:hypothetical protein
MAIWPAALILVVIVLIVDSRSAPTSYYGIGVVAGLMSLLGLAARRSKRRGPKLDEKSRLDLS